MTKSRRKFLVLGTGAAALSSCGKLKPDIVVDGADMRTYGERAPEEKTARVVRKLSSSPGTGSSRTPLQDLFGTITPSALHFERHHSGVPAINPATHTLLVHGLVERPLSFTVDDIRQFPSTSRICFLECGGNSVGEQAGKPPETVQQSHGLVSGSQWTGVPLSIILREAKLKPEAKWVVAEGADNCRLSRSIPIDKVMEDTLVVYGQNGEALRPEQGYPLRLIIPGWEGNTCVKWLHRLNVLDQPAMSSKETAYYTDLMPDGKAEMFTFVMDARSVITRPSGGQKLARQGFHEITGIAWSGRGKVQRVEVSTDGGKKWSDAELESPVLTQALTAFRFPWTWRGEEAVIQSRCTDETGYLQPTRDELIAVRGLNSGYHYNAVKQWKVTTDGAVTNV